jgi:hypothetical protein
MRKYLIGALIVFLTLGVTTLVAAQDSEKSKSQSAEKGSKDTNVDIRIQGEKPDKGRSAADADRQRGTPGPQGPAGAPGPQGASGPAGPSGGAFLGMDPTLALFIGLGVFAVVIVAIVAASRGGNR